MAELGFFDGQRVELIAGRIIKMSPIHNAHAAVLTALTELFAVLPKDRFWLRTQATLDLLGSLPEPDFAVVSGPRTHIGDFPTSAHLLIEVSDTTLRLDRGAKRMLYAKAAIPEYWIVNLTNRSVECYSDPARIDKKSTYRRMLIQRDADLLSPQCFPSLQFPVAALFQ